MFRYQVQSMKIGNYPKLTAHKRPCSAHTARLEDSHGDILNTNNQSIHNDCHLFSFIFKCMNLLYISQNGPGHITFAGCCAQHAIVYIKILNLLCLLKYVFKTKHW